MNKTVMKFLIVLLGLLMVLAFTGSAAKYLLPIALLILGVYIARELVNWSKVQDPEDDGSTKDS